MPWASAEEALAVTSIEDLSPGAIRAFLDLEQGGLPGVEMLDEAQLTEYFGKFWPIAKAFKTQGGPDKQFREFAGFFGLYALVNLNAYPISKSRGSLLVAEWENRNIDWAIVVSEALIREVSATRMKFLAGLLYWLAIIYPPPPGAEKGGSRPNNREAKAAAIRTRLPQALPEAGPSSVGHVNKAAGKLADPPCTRVPEPRPEERPAPAQPANPDSEEEMPL
jgi:hypothetical protein